MVMQSKLINEIQCRMCKWIIKHYWSEKTHSATWEKPDWLTSGEELNKEQEEIKEIFSKTLNNTTYYNRLSTDRLAEEEIGDFHIKYSYNKKLDPLSRDPKSRNVTEITMCINKKEGRRSNKFLCAGLIFVVLLGIFFFVNMVSKSVSTDTDIKDAPREKILAQESTTSATAQKKKELSKPEQLKEEICKIEELNVKNPEECWQYYVYDRCRDKVALAYQKWLKSTTIPECAGVKSYPWDITRMKKRWDDFPDKIKKDKTMKQNIEQFFTEGVEGE